MESRSSSAATCAIAIMGATATGKSALALTLALDHSGEIVSMDSRQVYRGLDIGTGKVGEEERARVPHHLLDMLDPVETGSAGRHAAMAEASARAIAARGRVPILAGGTGLYFRALFRGLVAVQIPARELESIRASFRGVPTQVLYDELTARDPVRARELSRGDRVRVTRALELVRYTGTPASELYRAAEMRGSASAGIRYLKLVLTLPRPQLRARVEARTRELFRAGWVEEVKGLLARGVPRDAPALSSLGYQEIVAALQAGADMEGCIERVITATQQYAKRQETFFRSEKDAVWVDVSEAGAETRARALVADFLRASGGSFAT